MSASPHPVVPRSARTALRQLAIVGSAVAALGIALSTSLESQRSTSRSPSRAVPLRVAFVDVQQLLDSVPGRGAVATRFADEVRLAETRVRLAADSLQRSVEQFSRQQHELAPMQREAAMLTLRARELQLEDMVQQLNLTARDRREAMTEPLMACVQRAVREVQQRDGWHAIADLGALGVLVEPNAEVVVTAQVLAALRARADSPCA
jgi:Skp family chaperone for outer membrane proteins